MTITDVRLTPVSTPRAGIVCGHVIVELLTDHDGLVGLGEMSDFQHLPRYHVDVPELERALKGLLVGLDPRASNEIERRLEDSFPMSGNLYDKTSVIRCGVDIGFWDLRGKLAGASLSELLGGRVRNALPIAFPIFRAQSAADVEVNLATMACRLQQGFSRFRVYVGRYPELDEAFLNAARERFGDAVMLKSLDFSNLLDAHAAARFVERTRHLGYEFVEAPASTGDIEGLRYVRDRTLVPVSEHVTSPQWALRLIEGRAVDVLNVGLFVLGGITPAQRVLAIAGAAGINCLIGTTQELSIGTAAAAHVGVTSPVANAPADPVGPLLYSVDVVSKPLDFRDSSLYPPDGPGIGVQIDRKLLSAARAPLTWELVDAATAVDRIGGSGA